MTTYEPANGSRGRRAAILAVVVCGTVALAGYASLSYLADSGAPGKGSASLEWGVGSYSVSLLDCSGLPLVDFNLPPASVPLGSTYGLTMTVYSHGMRCAGLGNSTQGAKVVGVRVIYQPYPGMANTQPAVVSASQWPNCAWGDNGAAQYSLQGVPAPVAPGHFVVTLEATVEPC